MSLRVSFKFASSHCFHHIAQHKKRLYSTLCYTPGFHIGLTVPPIFHFPPKSNFVLPITCKWFRFLYSPKHTSCLHHSKEMWDTLIREPESNIRINRSEMGTSNHTETNLKKMITPSSSLLRWCSLINSSQSYCLINFPNKWIKNIYIYLTQLVGDVSLLQPIRDLLQTPFFGNPLS